MKIIATYIYVIYYFLAVSFLLEYKLKKKHTMSVIFLVNKMNIYLS